jgi:hypothetical protein
MPTFASYLVHLKVDPTTLGITAALSGKKLHKYLVSVTNAASQPITAAYTFLIDYRHFYYSHDFLFVNSLGGIDTVRATGENERSIDKQFDEADGLDNQNWNSLITGSNIRQSGVTWRGINKGNIGFMVDRDTQEAYIDLLLNKAFLLLNGRIVPVVFTSKGINLGKSTDKLISLPIEWQLSEENISYTPSWVDMPAIGSDNETYP